MGSFKDLRIVDNFYQTSAFFPMPTVLISTLAEDGTTSLGAYSLVQPYFKGLCSMGKGKQCYTDYGRAYGYH